MKFYSKQHRYYCGIDLHAKSMYICIIDNNNQVKFHKNLKTKPEALLKAIKPFQDDIVVAVECMFCWYWVADTCEDNNIPFILGHALYMKAIHGGKAKNDKVDSYKIANLVKGGNFPVAYAYPRHMRSTRDLLRRRMHLMRKKAELVCHVLNTNTQYNLDPLVKNLRYRANRRLVDDRFDDPSVQKSVDLDIELINFYDEKLKQVEYYIRKHAKVTDYQSYMLLNSVPGIGQIISLVLLYEIYDIKRFPKVSDFASYARLIKCKSESGGKNHGTSGAKIGNAHLKWAFSEAAVLFLRGNDRGKAYQNKLLKKHPPGKTLSIIAHKIGRAVYFILKRKEPFNMDLFLPA